MTRSLGRLLGRADERVRGIIALCKALLLASFVFAGTSPSVGCLLPTANPPRQRCCSFFLNTDRPSPPPPKHAHAHCAVVVVLCVPGLSTAVRLAALGVVAASLGLTAYIVLVHLGALEAEWGIDGASAARRRASELRARCPDILPLVRYDGREGSYHRSSVAMDTLRSYPVRTTKLFKGVACARPARGC